MYLSIGNSYMVRKADILGIFDMDNATWSRWTRQTLTLAEQSGQVIDAAPGDIPNAFVLCREDGAQKIYLSALTAATLRRRVEEPMI